MPCGRSGAHRGSYESRLAMWLGVLSDQLGDVDHGVRGLQPDGVKERVLDQERAAAVVRVSESRYAREMDEAVIGGVVGALAPEVTPAPLRTPAKVPRTSTISALDAARAAFDARPPARATAHADRARRGVKR